MLLIISDACVLIDIEKGELSSAIKKLPFSLAISDVVYEQELAEQHSRLIECGLIIKTIDSELIAQAQRITLEHRGVSINDLLGLVLARDEGAMLLTGDRALRELATSMGVCVHGTIWMVEQMLDSQLITVELAKGAFNQMKAEGSRLPWNEVEGMIRRFTP